MRSTPVPPPRSAFHPSVPPLPSLSALTPPQHPHLSPTRTEIMSFLGTGIIPASQTSSPENTLSAGCSPNCSSHPSQTTFSPSGIHHVLKQNSPSHAAPSQVPWDELPAGWVWPEQPVFTGKTGSQLPQTPSQPSRAPTAPVLGRNTPSPQWDSHGCCQRTSCW